MKKLIKKLLAPLIREVIQEDKEIKKVVLQQSSEALERAMGKALKF